MKPVDKSTVSRYVGRCERCLLVMRASHDPVSPTVAGDAVVLLAIHGSIALSDAIQIACTGTRSKDQDHLKAAAELRSLCGKQKIDLGGVSHFEWLLKNKTQFAYGERRISAEDINLAYSKAERFSKWAYQNFPEIAHEEDGDAQSA